MGHTWILAVLDDLRLYAEINGLSALAASLDEAARVAGDEIARAGTGAPGWGRGHGLGDGTLARPAGGRADAC